MNMYGFHVPDVVGHNEPMRTGLEGRVVVRMLLSTEEASFTVSLLVVYREPLRCRLLKAS